MKKAKRRNSDCQSDHSKLKNVIQELKGENRKLRKEVSRLKKQLTHQYDVQDAIQEITPNEHIELVNTVQSKKESKRSLVCGKCKSLNVVEVPIGNFIVFKCNDCNWKHRKKVLDGSDTP